MSQPLWSWDSNSHFAPSLWGRECLAVCASLHSLPSLSPGFFPKVCPHLRASSKVWQVPVSPSGQECAPSQTWGSQQGLNRSGFLPQGEHNSCFVHPESSHSPGRERMQSLHIKLHPGIFQFQGWSLPITAELCRPPGDPCVSLLSLDS